MQRPPAQKFQDLIVWQKSHQLALRVCELCDRIPRGVFFIGQLQEAAASVPAYWMLTLF